jgi:radical SAM protein
LTRPPWTLRTDLSEAPIFVCWETTKSCLLACKHCRAKAIRKPLPGELSHGDGLQLIDQLVEFGEPYPALLLTGGDPLMRPDFFTLIQYAKSRGVYVAIASSVTPKLNRKSINKMKRLDVDIMSVSLDGATPATHDKLRGVPGTWNATMQALESARDLGLRAQINTTVMRSNLHELADIFQIVKQTGSVAWEVFFLIRTGRGASLESLQADETEDVMHFLFDASQYGVPVRTAEGPQFRRVRVQRQNGKPPPTNPLYRELAARLRELLGEPTASPLGKYTPTRDGKGLMFVGHNGEVYPSGFLPVKTGRLPRDHLLSIYRTNTLFNSLRDPSALRGRCGRCEYRSVCGGSRSRAYAEFGDPLQEDPACPYIPGTQLAEPIAERLGMS